MNHGQVCQQITDVISLLVTAGLCDHQRFPATRVVGAQLQVCIPDAPDLSKSLKYIRYSQMYSELRKSEAYHIRMLDGALIQLLYTFEKSTLTSHRLAFFPSPTLEMYESVPEHYELDETFADIVGEYSIKFPVRFDYSSSESEHRETDHPKSHLTLGQYKGCRIPVNSPLTPFRFMRFILRNFYNPAYDSVSLDLKAQESRFDEVITPAERRILYVTA